MEKDSKKENFLTKFKNLMRNKKSLFVGGILLVVVILGGILLFTKEEKQELEEENSIKLKASESGNYYAKYEVDIQDKKAFELENEKRVVFSYNAAKKELIFAYNNEFSTVLSNNNVVFYTIGNYVIIDNEQNIPLIYKNDGSILEIVKDGIGTGLVTEKGLAYKSYEVSDEGLLINYSREQKKNYVTNSDNKDVNVCSEKEIFNALDDDLIYSFDYIWEYNKENKSLDKVEEARNVVSIGEFKKEFDEKRCMEKTTYYVYKQKNYEGKENYSFSEDKPTDGEEIIDTYECKSLDCTYNALYDYDKNGNEILNRKYIYDDGKVLKYDMRLNNGFKEVEKSDLTLDVKKYNLNIEKYVDDKINIYLAADNNYNEHILLVENGDDYIQSTETKRSIAISEESIKNNIIGINEYDDEGTSNFIVYDFKNDKLIDEIDGYYYGELNYKNGYLFVTFLISTNIINYVYDKNYQKIVDEKNDDFFTIIDGKIIDTIEKNNVYNSYKIIDKDKIDYSNTYKEILMFENNLGVVVNLDNKLQIIDLLTEKVLADFGEYKDSYYFHRLLSGDWEKDNKKGLYLIFGDKNVKCEDIPESELKSFFGEDSYEKALVACQSDFADELEENSGLGVELHYIYDTGEVGKSYTLIGGYAKPVLYLYPEKDKTNITVKFENPDVLTTTYPKYKSYWEVKASKDGTLIDKNGRSYYGLYWEESGSIKVDFSEGFYVTKDNAIDFLEEKLDTLGFTEREANEFIMYWLPILEKNGKSVVYFELTESREAYNGLDITPKPNSMLRVAIHIKKVSKKPNIKEEHLPTFIREGFTVVEWGGVIHK